MDFCVIAVSSHWKDDRPQARRITWDGRRYQRARRSPQKPLAGHGRQPHAIPMTGAKRLPKRATRPWFVHIGPEPQDYRSWKASVR